MTQYRKTLGVCLVAMFGLWGCARGPSSQTSNSGNERFKALEVKITKLEEDLKASLASKERCQNLREVEEVGNQLQQEIARCSLS